MTMDSTEHKKQLRWRTEIRGKKKNTSVKKIRLKVLGNKGSKRPKDSRKGKESRRRSRRRSGGGQGKAGAGEREGAEKTGDKVETHYKTRCGNRAVHDGQGEKHGEEGEVEE
jgi:hypothetical protein